MSRKQFTFYRSYYEAICSLPAKMQANVLLAICAYALDDREPSLTGTENAIFSLVRPTLDAGRKKSEGRLNRERSSQDAGKIPSRCEQDAVKEKENEKEKEKEVERENECYNTTSSSRTMKRPTVDEVRAYCEERCNCVDPERFVDHYTANGWKVGGKTPMKDWKACVRTWEKQSDRFPGGSSWGGGRRESKNGFDSSNPFAEMLQEERGG